MCISKTTKTEVLVFYEFFRICNGYDKYESLQNNTPFSLEVACLIFTQSPFLLPMKVFPVLLNFHLCFQQNSD